VLARAAAAEMVREAVEFGVMVVKQVAGVGLEASGMGVAKETRSKAVVGREAVYRAVELARLGAQTAAEVAGTKQTAATKAEAT